MQVTLARGWSLAGIDNDPTATIVTLLPKELVQYRESLSTIRSGNQQYFRKWNVIPWICRAVDAEGFAVCRGSRDHAKPPVVINVTSPQAGSGKLTHQISLLGRKRRTGIDAN